MKDYVESEAVNIEICGERDAAGVCTYERGHAGRHSTWLVNSSVELQREALEMRAKGEAERAGLHAIAALKADAERLAQLRRGLAARRNMPAMVASEDDVERVRRDRILIAVYEECAARGLTFGGGR